MKEFRIVHESTLVHDVDYVESWAMETLCPQKTSRCQACDRFYSISVNLNAYQCENIAERVLNSCIYLKNLYSPSAIGNPSHSVIV